MIAVDSGYFYAGIIFENDIAIKAARSIGKSKKYILDCCKRKNWKVYEI